MMVADILPRKYVDLLFYRPFLTPHESYQVVGIQICRRVYQFLSFSITFSCRSWVWCLCADACALIHVSRDTRQPSMSSQAYPISYRYQPQSITPGSYNPSHYPTQFTQTPQFPLSQNPYAALGPFQRHSRYSPPPELPPPPPDLTSVDPRVASQAIERLILVGLRDAGFTAAQPVALRRLEHEVVTCEAAHFDSRYKKCHRNKFL
jgi:hypothetical protein